MFYLLPCFLIRLTFNNILAEMEACINLMQVLEKDLAIFGFFIALGRSTQSFLSANGFDVLDDSLGSFIRYTLRISQKIWCWFSSFGCVYGFLF